MRLISYHADTAPPRLGVVVGDRFAAATSIDPRLETIYDLLRLPAAIQSIDHDQVSDLVAARGRPLSSVRLAAPIPRPGKVVCVGRNYREHVEEEGTDAPSSPILFSKLTSSVVGPDDEIRWDPDLTSQVDYEAELAAVIGRTARHVAVSDALDFVLGYTCLNDVSARDLQFGDEQWLRGKSLDTFCPMGPALVTADEVGNPQTLDIRCRIGDEVMQDSNTSLMYFGVAEIISFCSEAFTLEPGDVIATGTPGGVGIFRPVPRLLTDGDVVTVEIERIGSLSNTCSFVSHS
jgi:2-keto-4-pentenoate hydratase/2-oxohepta-3-ene-1,7-dioic acid hydratase in catechol pathway